MLDISLGLLILTIAVFLGLVVVLNAWLYKPLLKFMQERDESIRRDLENASNNESGAKELLEEAAAIVNGAKHAAASKKKEAIELAKAEVAKRIEEKRAELEKRYSQFLEELAEEEKTLSSALISQTPLFKEALKAKFNQL